MESLKQILLLPQIKKQKITQKVKITKPRGWGEGGTNFLSPPEEEGKFQNTKINKICI